MKKSVWVFILVGLVLINYGVASVSADIFDSFDSKVDGVLDTKEKIDNFYSNESKWDYLGDEWRKVFLNNTYVARFDESMKRINPLVFFLFGEDYRFGITFLFVVILWAVFFSTFISSMTLFSPYSKFTGFASSFILVLIAAHLGILRFISDTVFKLLFYKDSVLRWGLTWLIILGLIAYIAFSYQLIRRFRIWWRKKKRREKVKDDEEQLARGARVAEEIERAASDGLFEYVPDRKVRKSRGSDRSYEEQ